MSSSPKIKKNAFQLLQGLEITLKLRKQVHITSKPVIDMEAMQTMSSMLRAGLMDEWSRYRRKDAPRSWNYGKSEDDLYKLETAYDTYTLLLMSVRSSLFLERVPPAIMKRAVRKMFLLSNAEKIELINQRMSSFLDNTDDSKECLKMKLRRTEKSSISSSANFML